jgi:5-methylcytosine-specific restriction protein A
MSSWRDLSERLSGKAPKGTRRSSRWRKFRDGLLKGNSCACCGGKKSLIGHHRIPFHLAPDMELDPDNIIVLCEAKRYGINCHLLLGHCGNWRRANVYCDADVAYWKSKLKDMR